MKKVQKKTAYGKNELPALDGNSVGASRMVNVVVPLTIEQHEAIKALCDAYRLDVAEYAKGTMMTILNSTIPNNEEELLLGILCEANEDRNTGKHPVFETWKDQSANLKRHSMVTT